MILSSPTYAIIAICIKLTVCSQNLIFEEIQTAVLSCSVNVQGPNNGYIFWYSPTSQSAACTCSVVDNSVYCQCDNTNLHANYTNLQPTKSFLTIQNVSMQDTGIWRCVLGVDSRNNTDKGTYDVLVIARPTNATCASKFIDDFSQMEIKCFIKHIHPSGFCSMESVGYQVDLSHTRDSQGYYDSICSTKISLSTLTVGHKIFNIQIYPNNTNISYGISTQVTVDLDYPDPELIDCPSGENVNQNYIKLGTNATCTCRTKTTGNPPAKVVWSFNNTLVLSDSALSNVLQIDTSKKTGFFTCTVVNFFSPSAKNNTVSYIPQVAYGPSAVSLNVTPNTGLNICNQKPVNINIRCSTTDVNPPNVSFTITINGSSETAVTSLQEFSKKISLTVPGQLDISCTATNIMFASLNANTYTVLFLKKPPESAPVLMINQQPINNSTMNVQEGENITVSCKIIGGVPNTGNLSLTCGTNTSQAEGNIIHLALGNIGKERNGQTCTCRAEHVTQCHQTNMASATLNVLYEPAIIKFLAVTGNTTANEVANGSLVTFKCEADGNPRPVVTIGNKKKLYNTDATGTFSTVMTCQDGGTYNCDAKNGIEFHQLEQPNVTVYVSCPIQLTDTTLNNTTIFVTESKTFSQTINIFGHPTPRYFFIEKLNLVSNTYSTVNFKLINAYVAYDDEQKFSILYSYNDPPYGVLSISMQNINNSDFTHYILHASNSVTSEYLKYFFSLKEQQSSSSNDVVVAAIVGTLCGVVVTAIVLILFFKRQSISSLIQNKASKRETHNDNQTNVIDVHDYVNSRLPSSQNNIARGTGYEEVDIAIRYDSLDQIQSEASKYELVTIGEKGNYQNID